MDCGDKCEHVIAGRLSLVQEIRETLKSRGCYAEGASLSDVLQEVALALDKKDAEIAKLMNKLGEIGLQELKSTLSEMLHKGE